MEGQAQRGELATFRNYGLQYLELLDRQTRMVSTATSPVLRGNLQLLVDLGVEWLSIQYLKFGSVLQSVTDTRWRALYAMLHFYSQAIGITPTPLPILGEGYNSTGSFIYYRDRMRRVQNRHYVISVDGTDKPLFWPLALHELAHVWLGERDEVDRICESNLEPGILTSEEQTRRVEEALCDVLATRMMGPAYSYAFIEKLWAKMEAAPGEGYPSNSFRIECVARALDRQGFGSESADLRAIAGAKFEDAWEDELIAWSIDGIAGSASVISAVTQNQLDSDGGATSSPSVLLNDAWSRIDRSSAVSFGNVVDTSTSDILNGLERRSVSSNAGA